MQHAYENCEISDDEYVTASREVSQGHGHGKLPVYQLHYAVYYNASSEALDESSSFVPTSTVVPDADGAGDVKSSNVCARHYAETFLIRLMTLQSWLNELCSSTQRPFTARVVVHTVVVVRVYGSLVSMRHLNCCCNMLTYFNHACGELDLGTVI